VTRFARVLAEGAQGPCWARVEESHYGLLSGPPWSEPDPVGQVPLGRARLLAPATPSKIVCVGRNYAAHAKELQHEVPEEPLLFLKPPSSIIGPEEAIERPVAMSSLVHHEAELAVVLGRRLRDASAAEALAAAFGYTCANDVTARDLQRKEGKFTRAKGFDTFCPLGPHLVCGDELGDPHDLRLELTVDGELRQSGHASDMVFGVGALLSFISRVMTLEPGDVVLTGTPEGVGPLEAGQRVRVHIRGIGSLENPVVNRAP
jgi:2-keto-4-pentenoate hydratase/2-oxohepta-3-ene-1,7-dioic acid hydratase in catechol pathway